jgi:hypothetical protein
VTSWSKLTTAWEGFAADGVLDDAGLSGDLVEMDIELLRQFIVGRGRST